MNFNKHYCCKITLHRAKGYSSNRECVHLWKDLTFDLLLKYRWFFRYRAALIQVQYPMYYVEVEEISYDFIPEKTKAVKSLKDKIIANKGLLTKYNNKLAAFENKWNAEFEEYKAQWNSLFPIEDDELYNLYSDIGKNIAYQKAKSKIFQIQQKVLGLEKELLEIENDV